jgi:hypothetical protein
MPVQALAKGVANGVWNAFTGIRGDLVRQSLDFFAIDWWGHGRPLLVVMVLQSLSPEGRQRAHGAGHIFRRAAKRHNEEVHVGLPWVVDLVAVNVSVRNSSGARAAVDENMLHRRASWLSA